MDQPDPNNPTLWHNLKQKWNIGDMKTSHIENCILILKKKEPESLMKGSTPKKWIAAFERELANRTDTLDPSNDIIIRAKDVWLEDKDLVVVDCTDRTYRISGLSEDTLKSILP